MTHVMSATPVDKVAPPLLSTDPKQRMPPPNLVQVMGPLLATYLHNYQRAGTIYRYYDPYAGKEMVAMAGVEANLFVMRHGRSLFGAQTFRQKQLDELGSNKYLVGMDGNDHYHHRKVQTRGYSRTILDQRYPELAGIAVKYARQWEQGHSFSVYPAMQQIVTEQIGTMMLNHAAPEKWQTICLYVSTLITKSFSRKGLDETRQRLYDEAKGDVMAMIDEVIADHRATPHGSHRPDLVDDLLAAIADGRDALTEQELRIDALTPYIAGIEPVTHSCTFMLYALLHHPELLQRVMTEVKGVLADKPLSPESVREMKELRYATMEMLRMYPFAPVLQMVALEDFQFQGFYVEAGTQLIVSQAVTHYLPELFANPYQFDSDRYKADRAEHRQSGAFAPYGVGHHICLGAGFSEIQIMVTMAAILTTVELEREPNGVPLTLGMRDLGSFRVRVAG